MHHAIHGHALTGAQTENIPHDNLFNGTVHKFPRPPHQRGLHP